MIRSGRDEAIHDAALRTPVASAPPIPMNAAVGRLGYQPMLDGLRAVAVALVVMHHLESPESSPIFVRGAANIGVDVFFVISGFLITRLMLDEHSNTGRISLLQFWKRRALRLLPLAVGVIAAVWLIDLVWNNAFYRAGAPVSSTRSALAALTYHMNFMMMFDGTAHEWALTHTWSLSIEEQFYLVWPIIVIALVRVWRRDPARGVIIGSAAIVITSTIVRFITADDLDRMYNGIDSRAGQLCMGCVLAGISVAAPGVFRRLGRAGPFALITIVLIALVYDLTFHWRGLAFDLVAILAALAVAGSVDQPASRLKTLACSKPAHWMGTRSYAIYLVHYPVFLMLTPTRLEAFPTPVMWTIRLVAGLGAAELAHRAIERPVARRRERSATAAASVSVPAHTTS